MIIGFNALSTAPGEPVQTVSYLITRVETPGELYQAYSIPKGLVY